MWYNYTVTRTISIHPPRAATCSSSILLVCPRGSILSSPDKICVKARIIMIRTLIPPGCLFLFAFLSSYERPPQTLNCRTRKEQDLSPSWGDSRRRRIERTEHNPVPLGGIQRWECESEANKLWTRRAPPQTTSQPSSPSWRRTSERSVQLFHDGFSGVEREWEEGQPRHGCREYEVEGGTSDMPLQPEL